MFFSKVYITLCGVSIYHAKRGSEQYETTDKKYLCVWNDVVVDRDGAPDDPRNRRDL